MFKEIKVVATFNERTGYGIHGSRFFPKLLDRLGKFKDGEGVATVSLLDVVSASHVTAVHPSPSILYNVWESTEYPMAFMEKLKNYDQLWVPSEWQRSCSIAQGIPEEFVKVVPEGVDPDVYKPVDVEIGEIFTFVHVGQWQPRKSTLEVIQSFLKAFPDNDSVRLELSVDTLFPSDQYKSTEERLEACGIKDKRIIVVHFEEREDYIRRLQRAGCFVSCSRSEGWGLPIIEAMACGVPTIVADFGGSTEYATDAIKVRVPKLIKPYGIYGNWDVPGFWGEPDFDHLVEQMRAVYSDYSGYKKRALASSERIRRDFSWDKAADKAMVILESLSQRYKPQEYKIENKKEGVFVVDCWPSSKEKMQTLVETVEQIHSYGFPVIITSHYALPDEVIKKAEYYIYDREDIMSGDDKPYYWRIRPDGTRETKRANVEYQGVAAINNFRNAIDFCRGRFEWVYQMGADIEVDMETWLSLVSSSKKDLICIPYEGIKNGVGGGIMAGKTELYDKLIPRLKSWKQYADMYPNEKFVAERWLYRHFKDTMPDFDNIVDWVQIETTNRWDNVDRTVWADDDFICHFVEGPFLQIVGGSVNEYDVEWSTPTNPLLYTLKQKAGMWSRPNIKYYQPWTVKAKLNGEVKFEHSFDPRGKRVLVCMGSKALGDTLAWMPYVEEFRKKWDCHLICSSWWIDILDYPEIEYVKPGSGVENIYASFNVGCFDNQLELNVENWRTTILQKVSADILGIDYTPIKAKLKFTPHREGNGKPKKPYVCFSEYSTMQNKFWNREGAWQKIIDYLVDLGYDCVSISPEGTLLKNVIQHNGQPIEHTISDIAGCEFYLGLNHGPAWIAYSLGVPAVMITGVSEPWNDFPNPYRVSSDVCRPGCFNDPSLPINRGWEWCPRNKNYECTRAITEGMVIEAINRLRKDYGYACEIQKTAEIDGDGRTPSGNDLGEEQWGAINVKRPVA
jgi:autotransporter strand-loop-strand O-heptosyltransferase